MGWIAAGCTLAFAGARAGSQWLGVEMGALCGALLLGIASNLYARWRARPASVTLVPGLMLLVPGAVGFRSISSLLQSDVVSGMEAAFRMGVTGVALVTGLLIANTLLPSRRAM